MRLSRTTRCLAAGAVILALFVSWTLTTPSRVTSADLIRGAGGWCDPCSGCSPATCSSAGCGGTSGKSCDPGSGDKRCSWDFGSHPCTGSDYCRGLPPCTSCG